MTAEAAIERRESATGDPANRGRPETGAAVVSFPG